MQKWLDLLTPSAAALSLLLAIALLIQAIRHGRAVRRLESRLAEREGAAARVSLDRLQQLQRRTKPSSLVPTPARPRRGPNLATTGIIVAVVALIAGSTWYLFLRDGDSGASAAGNGTTTSATTTAPAQPRPVTSNQVPDEPEPLPQTKSVYTILVLNGSGRDGAAGRIVAPYLEGTLGWHTADPANAPTSDVKTSFVIWLPGKEVVADNLAKDLEIRRKEPLDGVEVPQDQVDDVDAIVVVGTDLVTRLAP